MVIVGYEVAGRSMAALQAFYVGRGLRGSGGLHAVLHGIGAWLREGGPA